MTSRGLATAYSETGAAWQVGAGPIYDRLAEVLVEASPVPLQGLTLLDLGAGTGAATRAVASAGGASVAADLAPGMLRAIGEPRPASVVADALALPFAPKALDGVVAAFSLNHLPDPRRAILEALRVTRRGGPLLVSAYAADDHHPVKEAVNTAAAELGWRPESWVDALREHSIPVLASVEGATRVVAEAGLTTAVVRRVEIAFPELGPEALVAWRCGMAHTAPFVATLGPAARARLAARAIELLGDPAPLVRRVILITAVA